RQIARRAEAFSRVSCRGLQSSRSPDPAAMHSHAKHFRRIALSSSVLMLMTLCSPRAHAQDVTNDGRVGVILAHPTMLDDVSGAPYFWFDDQTGDVKQFRVAFPNIIYHAKPWLQGWTGLFVEWKND